MKNAEARVARLFVVGVLFCAGHTPALENGKASAEAQIKKEATQAARAFLEAVQKRDVKGILAMLSERGLRCHDDYTPRNEIATALRKPGTFYHALLFDSDRLREYVRGEPPVVSLLEMVESGGELTLEVRFWDDYRGPLSSPCVYVKAAKLEHEEPTLCFHKEKGRWRLWKSPDPDCS